MRYVYSTHAREEAARRNIPLAAIDAVLDHPEQIVPEHHGREAYQSRVNFGSGRVFLLRVIVASQIDPAVVVTAYRTTKISKYWRMP